MRITKFGKDISIAMKTDFLFITVYSFLLPLAHGSETSAPAICKPQCQNGGECIEKIIGANECDCSTAPGYYGPSCSDEYCKHNSDACKDNESCTSNHTTPPYYDCVCQGGYYGQNCDKGYCEHNMNSCTINEICTSDHMTPPYYNCTCKDGYYGQDCNKGYCEYNSYECKGNGKCNSNHTTPPYYDCACEDGYYGQDCDKGYCEYNSYNCNGNGTCSPNHNHMPYYECDCLIGYYGQDCIEGYCEFNSHTCNGNGTCYSNYGTSPIYYCDCFDGYYGQDCEESYCEHHPNPCKNGGDCKSTEDANNYECICSAEYIGKNCTKEKYFTNSRNTCKYHVNYNSETYAGFEKANHNCAMLGGSLAMDKNNELHKSIQEAIQVIHGDKSMNCWLGGITNGSSYVWLDGSDVSTDDANWGSNSPDYPDDPKENSCIRVTGNDVLLWDSESCRYAFGWICEVPVSGKFPCKDYDPCVKGNCLSTGCQWTCTCESGYFKEKCDAALIEIDSPTNITGVSKDQLTINLTILSFDGPVQIKVTKNDIFIETFDSGVDDGIFPYIIDVTEGSKGLYKFAASSREGGYNFSTTTEVDVHVRAFIDQVDRNFIYSPVWDSPSNVSCLVGGTPAPKKGDFGWYRNDNKVINSSGNGVYQKLDGLYAFLYVEEALPFDDGDYYCYVSNVVGYESEISKEQSDFIKVSVYDVPDVLQANGVLCSQEGKIEVIWTSDNRTNNVNHTFYANAKNSSSPASTPAQEITSVNGKNITLENLSPYTMYEIKVEVCPEYGCIHELNKTEIATTGHGLPGEINQASIELIGNDRCHVRWGDVFTTPIDQVLKYKVSWTAFVAESFEGDVKELLGSVEVAYNVEHSYSIETIPNKVYVVNVTAYTCAGYGDPITAKGNCITEKDVPGSVPKPIFLTDQNDLRQSERDVAIPTFEDESNGTISCLLVILFKAVKVGDILVTEDLERLSNNAVNGNTEGGYLAIALKRSEINLGELVNVTLGNNSKSDCNVYGNQDIIRKQGQDSANTSILQAKNHALDYKGETYSMVVITTTPINATYAKLQTSEVEQFTQGKSLAWVAACVLVPLAMAAICIALWIHAKKRRKHKTSSTKTMVQQRGNANPAFDEFDQDDQLYENSEAVRTNLPLKDLKRYYLFMLADESLHFREQYGDLRRQAKATAPSSTFGSTDQAMTKNRYRNILPYDDTRVRLSGEGFETYINACYVTGYNKQFIAAQGPLPYTIEDFWRMIVEQHCTVIVMLTRCQETGKTKCAKYWPDMKLPVRSGVYTITNVGEEDAGGIIKRDFIIEAHGMSKLEIVQYHYVRWPDHGIPVSTSAFFRLHKRMLAEMESSSGNSNPIVIHCSAGVGRTGTFIAFDKLLGGKKMSVDIYNCVLRLRKERVDMVQTSEQYQFLHKLMLENYLFGDTDMNPDRIQSSTNLTRLREEFHNLKEAESLESQQQYKPGSNVVIVRQLEDTEWVTIDGKFVEAYKGQIRYIASEGPCNSTVEYFLRALWDNDVDVVVMLNNPAYETEDPEAQFATYWPETTNCPVNYNSISIELLQERDDKCTVERNFRLSRRNRAPRDVKQFQYLGWPSQLPSSRNFVDIINLITRLSYIDLGRPATIMVHCTDGFGRTGVFIAVANIIARLQVENKVDVFRTVKDLRDARPGIVQNLAQYKLCYDLTKCFLQQGNVYTNGDVRTEEEDFEDEPVYQNY